MVSPPAAQAPPGGPATADRASGPAGSGPVTPRRPAPGGLGPVLAAGLRTMVRPVRSSPAGTMPAGTVLVVMVGALVLALVLSPLVGPRFGPVPDPPVPAPVSDPAVIEAGAGARSPAGQPTVPAPAAPGGPAPAGELGPRLPAPTPDRPLAMWVGGDERSIELGLGLEQLADRTRLLAVTREARGTAGLSRADGYDWPGHLARDVAMPARDGGIDPDVAVVLFGGDDRDLPEGPDGPAVAAGSPEWRERYRRRVAAAMDALRPGARDRLVLWVGLPAADPATPSHTGAINAIYASEAATRPWVRYFDAYAFLADPFGRYSQALANADGRTRAMRTDDGIGLSAAGGTRLARAVHARLATLVDLRAVPLVPEPAQSAPPSVTERPLATVLAG